MVVWFIIIAFQWLSFHVGMKRFCVLRSIRVPSGDFPLFIFVSRIINMLSVVGYVCPGVSIICRAILIWVSESQALGPCWMWMPSFESFIFMNPICVCELPPGLCSGDIFSVFWYRLLCMTLVTVLLVYKSLPLLSLLFTVVTLGLCLRFFLVASTTCLVGRR